MNTTSMTHSCAVELLIELAICLHTHDKNIHRTQELFLKPRILSMDEIFKLHFSIFFSRGPSVFLSREWTVKSEHLLPELKLVDWLIMQVVRNILCWYYNIMVL